MGEEIVIDVLKMCARKTQEGIVKRPELLLNFQYLKFSVQRSRQSFFAKYRDKNSCALSMRKAP